MSFGTARAETHPALAPCQNGQLVLQTHHFFLLKPLQTTFIFLYLLPPMFRKANSGMHFQITSGAKHHLAIITHKFSLIITTIAFSSLSFLIFLKSANYLGMLGIIFATLGKRLRTDTCLLLIQIVAARCTD